MIPELVSSLGILPAAPTITHRKPPRFRLWFSFIMFRNRQKKLSFCGGKFRSWCEHLHIKGFSLEKWRYCDLFVGQFIGLKGCLTQNYSIGFCTQNFELIKKTIKTLNVTFGNFSFNVFRWVQFFTVYAEFIRIYDPFRMAT